MFRFLHFHHRASGSTTAPRATTATSFPFLLPNFVSCSSDNLRTHLIQYSRSRGNFRALRMSSAGAGSSSDGDRGSTAAVAQPVVHKPQVRFCQSCGGETKQVIPEGEEKIRAVCSVCGKIHYENPKMVVGCLVEHEGKVLLCKRKIEPSYGLWTLPAGYLEIGESAAEGAIRETLEEACAEVEVISPFAQLDIPRIGQ